MADLGGVWRTISGRKVFIKDGQSLSEAMKTSGKFDIKVEKAKTYDNLKTQIDDIAKEFEGIDDVDELNEDFTNDLYDIFNEHSLDYTDTEFYLEKTQALYILNKLYKNSENLEFTPQVSGSPYSFSTYLLDQDDKIDWGYKPVGSLRVSDHWNFESRDKLHCMINGVTETNIQKVMVGIYNGESYDILWEAGE